MKLPALSPCSMYMSVVTSGAFEDLSLESMGKLRNLCDAHHQKHHSCFPCSKRHSLSRSKDQFATKQLSAANRLSRHSCSWCYLSLVSLPPPLPWPLCDLDLLPVWPLPLWPLPLPVWPLPWWPLPLPLPFVAWIVHSCACVKLSHRWPSFSNQHSFGCCMGASLHAHRVCGHVGSRMMKWAASLSR